MFQYICLCTCMYVYVCVCLRFEGVVLKERCGGVGVGVVVLKWRHSCLMVEWMASESSKADRATDLPSVFPTGACGLERRLTLVGEL